jgi:hypothetical protein
MQHIEIKTPHTIVITKLNRPICFALKINNDERKVQIKYLLIIYSEACMS